METKFASNINWKHIAICVIILVLFVVTIGININAESVPEETVADSSSDVVPLKANDRIPLAETENEVKIAGPKEEVTVVYDKIGSYITTYSEELKFFSDCFGVNYDDIIEDIKNIYNTNNELVETNVGHLLNSDGSIKTFETPERGIVEYFYDYVERNPKKVNNKWVAYKGGSKYIENLIIFYTTKVYINVDTKVALSIGACESGYYTSKYMLSVNNVYGGMGSNGLTKYKNIEYGVLSYIRVLSTGYYGIGLNTIESIGKKYCPKSDNNGNKVASPHWISLVKTAMKKYGTYNYDIEVEDLNLENANI